MRLTLGVSILAAAVTLGAPIAEAVRDPGSSASVRGGYSPVTIDAHVVAPDSCYEAVRSGRDGTTFIDNGDSIIPVTVALDRVGGPCTGAPTVVRSRFNIPGDAAAYLIEIKFVTASGALLKVERVAIDGR